MRWETQGSPSFLLHLTQAAVFPSARTAARTGLAPILEGTGQGHWQSHAGSGRGKEGGGAEKPRWDGMSTSSGSVVHLAAASWTHPAVGTGRDHNAIATDLPAEEQVPGASPASCFNCTSKPVGHPESTKNNQPRNPNRSSEMN